MSIEGTIIFKNSAYPKPHRITEFVWDLRVDDAGRYWFDLHLRTEDYYRSEGVDYDRDTEEDNDDDFSARGEWQSRDNWDNYHQCIISSTYWSEPQKGICLNPDGEEVNLESLLGNTLTLTANTLPVDSAEMNDAFNIYLLGHDRCTGHEIVFSKKDNGLYTVHWCGKIALTYQGYEDFEFSFEAIIQNVKAPTFEHF